MEHTSKDIIGKKSTRLEGKRICLCVTGSVAAVRSPDIARELMRNGAEVYCAMSEAAQKLVGKDLLHWATGNEVVTELTGKCEHISLAGEHKGKVDLVLVAPATANTIGKAANGIDDTVVTTILATAIGSRIPIVLVPAMHASMHNSLFEENAAKLQKHANAKFVMPRFEEGKAKIAEVEEIVDYCMRELLGKELAGKRVLVTAGATREYIDDVRFISNASSGKMGLAFAREAWLRGADVVVVKGHCDVQFPGHLQTIDAEGISEMREAVLEQVKRCDIAFMAAAVGDFLVSEKQSGKIDSEKNSELLVGLKRAPKIVSEMKKANPKCKLVVFKAEWDTSEEELAMRALERIGDADFIIGNDIAKHEFGDEESEVIVLGDGTKRKLSGRKEGIAEKVLDSI